MQSNSMDIPKYQSFENGPNEDSNVQNLTGSDRRQAFVDAVGAGFQKSVRRIKKNERCLRMKLEKIKTERDLVNDLSREESTLLTSSKSIPSPLHTRSFINNESIRSVKLSSLEVFRNMIFGSPTNLMLLFIPFAVASHKLNWSPTAVFVLNFLAMIPLATLLGDFTEEAAAHTNQTIGGLLNASFGNAVEVVVAVQALLAGEYRVVQASMIGSIFSNLLLVLGSCFFFGGLYYSEQEFQPMAATANMGLLGLSCIALVLPTPFAHYYEIDDVDVLTISRITAVFMIFMYAQLLFFQLKTHSSLLADAAGEEGEKMLPFYVAILGLVALTGLIAILSEFLVGSIDGFCNESGISRTFTGLIILPIVGNAVEHLTAISVAMKDKMDLAMGVAVGSSTQISLFVTPLIVLVGWATDRPMTLNFPPFEITLFILSVIVVAILVSYPRSNWLEGSMLITTYMMIAVGFWFEKIVAYRENDDVN